MPGIKENVLATIGRTPMVRLAKLSDRLGVDLCAKLESQNPGGSIKDRVGLAMIEAAERRGDLRPGGTVVEATAGNTGIGLAMAAAVKGYQAVFVMPEKMSRDKAALLEAYGARVIWTPTVGADSKEHYVAVARRIVEETDGAWLADQFENPDNPRAHYETTGPEIWADTAGQLDAFIAGMGTTGTVTGVGRYLKEQSPAVRIIVADPVGSVYGGGPCGSYVVEGIGNDHHPGIYDPTLVDEFVYVEDRDAFVTARRLAREEGILVGASGGAIIVAAERVAASMSEGQRIVVLLPDTGRNYAAKLLNEDWMREKGYWEEGE